MYLHNMNSIEAESFLRPDVHPVVDHMRAIQCQIYVFLEEHILISISIQ